MPTDLIELLIVNNGCPLPAGVASLLDGKQFRATTVGRIGDVREEVFSDRLAAAVVLNTAEDDAARAAIRLDADRLVERLGGACVGVILVTPDANGQVSSRRGSGYLDLVEPDTSGEELAGRFSAMARYRPLIQQLERELTNMQRLGKRLNLHFTEIDQEMRLASRLQHDFLPQELPTVGGIQVSSIYRPASWVSGDIYDVFRIDEDHIGLYVADAVGHGMAAGLLTMFIKRAMVPKRIDGQEYKVLDPGVVLAHLNDSLKHQNLPNCQFVTACYCVYNVCTGVLRVARGGHPYPIRVGTDSSLSEIRSVGGLLGVFEGETFETITTELGPGEKLMLYSDGIELAFLEHRERPSGEPRYKNEFRAVASASAKDLIKRIGEMLDAEEGSLHPQDDVTVIVLETPS